MIIYGIYDKKALSFRDLVYADNDDLVKRSLYRILGASEKSDYVMYPFDFAVYRLGTFEQDTGRVAGYDVKNIAFELVSLFKQPDDTDSSSGTDDSSGSPAVSERSEDVKE